MERREKRFASRILAWFLTFLMITTMIPTSAFAALPAQEAGAVVSEDASSDETTPGWYSFKDNFDGQA